MWKKVSAGIFLAFILISQISYFPPRGGSGGGGGYGAGYGLLVNGANLDVNSAVIAALDNVQNEESKICRSTTGNDTYTCTINPTPTLGDGTTGSLCVLLTTDFASSGPSTLNVNSIGAKSLQNPDGTDATVLANKPAHFCYDGTQFVAQGAGGAGGASTTTLSYFPSFSHTGVGTYASLICYGTSGCTYGSYVGSITLIKHLYADAATQSSLAVFSLPNNWDSTANITVNLTWISEFATSGDVVWGARGACAASGTAVYPTQSATQATTTTTTAGTVERVNYTTITLASANLASCSGGRIINIETQRLGSNGADTMSNSANIIGYRVDYGVVLP